ncbi:MAG: phage terminase large subunit family protein, partial [Planctomycetes bacterium]|nr:phage terminase large subunit family protein [Planctomycetota bacterium]
MAKKNRATEKHQRDAERKRIQRQQDRLVIIPRCKDRDRREALEDSDVNWLYYYFSEKSGVPDPFWYPFTNQHMAMIEGFGDAILHGGDQAVAASRSEGKTTILERLITKYTLHGQLSYSVLFQATGALADNSLDTIKQAIEENELLHDDYPEVCYPVRALENTPQRAHYQIVSGDRHDNLEPFKMAHSRFTWCGNEVIFPKVPGSPSSGAIIATRGLDGAVRGLKKRGRRPSLAAIDDPDTEETVLSEGQAKKLEDRIDKTIGGLGSQSKPVARIFLGTIQSRTACAYKYTDPKVKPSWKGKRFRYVITPPDNVVLWDEYVEIRSEEFRAFAAEKSTDKHCRKSHKFYLDNREKMDAGAVVANEYRFNPEVLADGTQVEVSSLQHFYNEVSRLGPEAADSEYNNDPPKEIGVSESTIDATKIQHRLSGYERRVVPPECTILTQGIDVRKRGLHWVVKAWRADATNFVIDYGIFDTHGTTYGSDEGVELAIRRAILGRMEETKEGTYRKVSGEKLEVGLTLVDSGWQAPAVYQACLEIGLGIFPAKGHGKSHGCATPNFYDVLKDTKDRKPGDG